MFRVSAVPASPRVLVVHPGALGDLVIARQALGALREAQPSSRIALVIGDDLAAFAGDALPVDECITFDASAAYRGRQVARAGVLAGLCVRARAFRPTHAAVCKPALVWAAVARASGARVRVGLTRSAGSRLLTRPITNWETQHHADRYAQVIDELDLGTRAVERPDLPPGLRWPAMPTVPDLAAARRSGGPLVGLAPGGARNAKYDTPAKRWPAARYAQLAARVLVREPAARIVLFGAASDVAEADVVRASVPAANLVDLVGRTSVLEARAAVAACDAFVCNDTALLHIAGTTCTPIVAVFGPTDPRVLAPRSRYVTVRWAPAGPAPCWDEAAGRLRECAGTCCIDRVTTAAVYDALAAALDARGPGYDRRRYCT